MSPETAAAVALDILRERGWCQNALENEQGQVCFYGALNVALTGQAEGVHSPHRTEVIRRVGHLMGFGSGAAIKTLDWNNDPHTTFEDVTLVLKRVANGEGNDA